MITNHGGLLTLCRKLSSAETSARTGGMLADVMGLGKTLTMLTAVASSKEAAERHREMYVQDEGQLVAARGTLVVVTSRRKSKSSPICCSEF